MVAQAEYDKMRAEAVFIMKGLIEALAHGYLCDGPEDHACLCAECDAWRFIRGEKTGRA